MGSTHCIILEKNVQKIKSDICEMPYCVHPSHRIESSVPYCFHSPLKRPSSSYSMAFQIKAKKRPWVGAPGYFRGATKFKAFCILFSLVFKKNLMKIGIIFIFIN